MIEILCPKDILRAHNEAGKRAREAPDGEFLRCHQIIASGKYITRHLSLTKEPDNNYFMDTVITIDYLFKYK